MAVHIKVRDVATGAILDMELEPDATAQEVLKGAAGYWGKPAAQFLLRKGRTVLRGSQTMIEIQLADGDVLEFLSAAEAARPVLLLEAGEGRSLVVERSTVLGRAQLQSLLPDAHYAAKISNRHVSVWHESGIFSIEDGARGQPSRNGTTLNDGDIRGRGRVPLRDGDVVGIARVLRLTVRITIGG